MMSTTLHLEAMTSRLERAGQVDQVLALGLATLGFTHTPPRPLELEHGIEITEEAVMPHAPRFGGGILRLRGEGARWLEGQSRWTLDEVEALFNRLAQRSAGQPDAALPDDPRFFAAVLILRECLHHLRFSAVEL